MKEAIIELRKTAEVLMRDYGYNIQKMSAEMGLAALTISNLLKNDLSELRGVRASTLGIIQDFNKKHVDRVAFAGAVAAPEKSISENQDNDKPVSHKSAKASRLYVKEKRLKKGKSKTYPTSEEIIPETLEAVIKPDFAQLLTELGKMIPSNVKVNITIN